MAFVSPLSLSSGSLSSPQLRRTSFRRPPFRAVARHSRNDRKLTMQTWSDPKAREEYFDYLEGRNQREDTHDCVSTIVGAGRIGSLLAKHGSGDLILRRGDPIPADAPGPIYVCTRNEDLKAIIDSCPPEKKEDLVFLQNGYLERFYRRNGVSENTKANIYFAVSKVNATPIDGVTETSPDGLTTVSGKWEGAFSERLRKAKLKCRILKDRDFRRSQLEKLIFISVYNLLGTVHGNIPMGEVSKMHEKEVTSMAVELATMVRYTLTVSMLPDIEKRMIAYGYKIRDFPTGFKEFEWRNGFFYQYSQLALKNGFPDPTPMHR